MFGALAPNKRHLRQAPKPAGHRGRTVFDWTRDFTRTTERF
jgi:hypothetical protein